MGVRGKGLQGEVPFPFPSPLAAKETRSFSPRRTPGWLLCPFGEIHLLHVAKHTSHKAPAELPAFGGQPRREAQRRSVRKRGTLLRQTEGREPCSRPFPRSGHAGASLVAVPEEQRDAPDAGQPHQGIDDPAENGHLPAAEEGYDVEAENADAAPVQRADDGQRQGNFVPYHGFPSNRDVNLRVGCR